MDSTLSKAFDLLRFPLAIMVVFLHIAPTPQVATLSFDWAATDGTPLYYMCLLSVDTLALIAVPCFFFISGYLFFANAETLDRPYYLHKLRRRVHTLLIPYIIWNVLAAVYLWLTQDIYYSPQWLVFTIPANFPLWFLRDLIVLIIASPLIGSIASQIGRTGLIILSVLFLSNLVPSLVVCRFQSFYFFYLGAFCSLRNHCFDFPSRRIISLYGLAVLLFGGSILSFGTSFAPHITALYLVVGVISVVLIARYFVQCGVRVIPLLSSASFFIYVTHKLGMTFVAKQFFSWLPQTAYTQTIRFLTAPFITAWLCLLVYMVWDRISPRTLSLFTGRKKHRL